MFQSLYDFFASVLFGDIPSNYFIKTVSWTIGGKTITLYQWFCNTLAITTLIFIFVFCCLFVYRIIKLVGNLIR